VLVCSWTFYFMFVCFALCLEEDITVFISVILCLESCLVQSCKILHLSLSVGRVRMWIPVIVTVTFYWENALSP